MVKDLKEGPEFDISDLLKSMVSLGFKVFFGIFMGQKTLIEFFPKKNRKKSDLSCLIAEKGLAPSRWAGLAQACSNAFW